MKQNSLRDKISLFKNTISVFFIFFPRAFHHFTSVLDACSSANTQAMWRCQRQSWEILSRCFAELTQLATGTKNYLVTHPYF